MKEIFNKTYLSFTPNSVFRVVYSLTDFHKDHADLKTKLYRSLENTWALSTSPLPEHTRKEFSYVAYVAFKNAEDSLLFKLYCQLPIAGVKMWPRHMFTIINIT